MFFVAVAFVGLNISHFENYWVSMSRVLSMKIFTGAFSDVTGTSTKKFIKAQIYSTLKFPKSNSNFTTNCHGTFS